MNETDRILARIAEIEQILRHTTSEDVRERCSRRLLTARSDSRNWTPVLERQPPLRRAPEPKKAKVARFPALPP
jgi:hypothetical protein